MTTPTRAANYLEANGFTNLASLVRERKTTPKQAAEAILEGCASFLRTDETKTFKRWAGR